MASSKVTFRIQRFDPAVDQEPRDQDFEIELPSGITILKALNKIRAEKTRRWRCATRAARRSADPAR